MTGDRTKQKAEATARPALQKLEADHDALVANLREPFKTRENLFEWMIRANVRTLGALPDDYYLEMYTDRMHLASFLGKKVGTYEPDEITTKRVRDDHAARVSSACRQAYRMFRKSAGEHFDEFDLVDVDGNDVALRPVLQETEDRQAEVITRARRGFDTRRELDDWLREANAAAFGELVDVINPYALASPDVYALLGEEEACPNRDMTLLLVIMPGFVRAVRLLRDRVGEHIGDDDGPDSDAMGDHIPV